MICRSKNLVTWISMMAIMAGFLIVPATARVNISVNLVIPSPYLAISPEESQLEDMVFLTACGRHFGFDVQILAPLWPRFTYPQISMICLLARESDTPISVIVRLREEGLGWDAICRRLGIYAPVFGEIRLWGRGETYDDACIPVFVQVIHTYYAVPAPIIWDMYHRRYPWGEIAMGANVARISHQPLERVLIWRSRKMGWNEIGTRARISPYELRRLYPSTIRYSTIIKPPKEKMGLGKQRVRPNVYQFGQSSSYRMRRKVSPGGPKIQIGPGKQRGRANIYQFGKSSASQMRYRVSPGRPKIQTGPGFLRRQGGKSIIMRQGNPGGGMKMGGKSNVGRGRGKGH